MKPVYDAYDGWAVRPRSPLFNVNVKPFVGYDNKTGFTTTVAARRKREARRTRRRNEAKADADAAAVEAAHPSGNQVRGRVSGRVCSLWE